MPRRTDSSELEGYKYHSYLRRLTLHALRSMEGFGSRRGPGWNDTVCHKFCARPGVFKNGSTARWALKGSGSCSEKALGAKVHWKFETPNVRNVLYC